MAHRKVDYLTAPQEHILTVIRRHIAEICAATGRSVGGVHYQLRELEAKAAIVREPGRPRGMRLT